MSGKEPMWTEEDERRHASIVDGLRRAGWDRLDAIEEADRRTATRCKPAAPRVQGVICTDLNGHSVRTGRLPS